MNNKILIGLLVLVAGIGVGWYVLGASKTNVVKTENSTENAMPLPGTTGVEESIVTTDPSAVSGGAMVDKGGVVTKTVITYTDSGFGPREVTVKKGSTVAFINESSSVMWVASAPHPQHTIYPEFDQLKSVPKGGSYEFIFTKVGTWKYHNHMKATDFGGVVVTE